jgi:histidinol phosphatase-like enzyme
LRALKAANFLLVVITNQPTGRGTQTRETVEAMHSKLIGNSVD